MRKMDFLLNHPPFLLIKNRFNVLWHRYNRLSKAMTGSFLLMVLAGSLSVRSSYQAAATMTIESKEIRDEWDLLKDETRSIDFEEQILSRAVLEQALRRLKLFPPKKFLFFSQPSEFTPEQENRLLSRAVSAFRRDLSVERVRHSAIVRITAKGKSPQDAADRANAVMYSFIQYRRSRVLETTERFIVGLDAELRSVRHLLEEQVAARSQFLARHGWDDYEEELKIAYEQVSTLKKRLQSVENFHQDFHSGQVLASADGTFLSDEPALRQLAIQLADADVRLSQAMSRYKDGNPVVINAQNEMSALEEALREKLKERHTVLYRQLYQEQKRLRLLMSAESEARSLDASINQSNRRYQELLTKQSEARLERTLWRRSPEVSEIFSVLDEAFPAPAKPWWLSIILTVLAGILLSVLCLFLTPFALYYWETKQIQRYLFARHHDYPAHGRRPSGIDPVHVEEEMAREPVFQSSSKPSF